jgi:hypothetical protein
LVLLFVNTLITNPYVIKKLKKYSYYPLPNSFSIVMLKNSFLFVLMLFFCFATQQVLAQAGNSPYSRFGLGENADRGGIYNMGMGGIGIASASQAYANVLNPALLVRNKLTCFEAGFWAETKNLVTNTELQATQSGNLGYLAISFPVARKVTLAFGLTPYTSINYTNKETELKAGTPSYVVYTYRGTGGINQGYVATGVEPIKDLYLGLRVNYNFGVIKEQTQSYVDDGQSSYKLQLLQRNNVGDFSFRLGANYRKNVAKEKFINVGATYDMAANISTNNFAAYQWLTPSDGVLYTDTISNAGSLSKIPAKYGVGISFEKPFHYLVGFDFSTQNWQNLTLNGANTFQVAFGGEWTPNPNSIDNYFKRISFRAGINYAQLPTVIKGTQLDEKSVSIGFSAPVMRGISSLNMAFVLGQRGTLENNLIQENFFRVNLGLTVNDQWFVRRRIN